MNSSEKKSLQITACKIRMDAVTGVFHAKSGHPGGSLSAADLLAYLYFKEMKVNPENPSDPDRDRFVLSKGHCCPGLYGALAERGFFSPEEMKTLRHIGSMLQGHPNMNDTPGVDMSTGSLGQGISAACGMAMAAKLDGKAYRVYSILGDGEINEGTVWEACMSASKYKVDNLCAVLDWNGVQLDGTAEDIMPMGDIKAKFDSFGFHCIECDGHDVEALYNAFEEAKTVKGKPTIVLAHTVKGKGVSFMEGKNTWHGKAIGDEEFAKAMEELGGAK